MLFAGLVLKEQFLSAFPFPILFFNDEIHFFSKAIYDFFHVVVIETHTGFERGVRISVGDVVLDHLVGGGKGRIGLKVFK